jgi:serine protease Do
MSKRTVFSFLAASCAIAALSLVSFNFVNSMNGFSNPPSYSNREAVPGLGGSDTIADIVESVGGSVVNIDVVKMQQQRIFNPFRDFERNFGGFGFELNPDFRNFYEERMIPIKGAGSGFVVDGNNRVLTNAHVVKNADKIKVTTRDGKSYDAEILGIDSTLDLAVLKINTRDKLPSLPLGDSASIRPGQWVIAIGNPYGFSNTVTAGIISATGRALDASKKNLIQIDAPINPGNSGGPLINLKGEAIGINVAIAAQAQGIGFAIPVNAAKEVINDLITKGKIIRPWLGIYMRDVDESVASYMNLPIPEGILITEVVKDSPAEKSGLKQYDVIREADGKAYKKSEDLSSFIAGKKPRDTIKLTVYREGKLWSITARLAERLEN